MRNIFIDHAVYLVVFENNEEMQKSKGQDGEITGQIHQSHRRITIAPEHPDDFKISTIWHEVIHGIWYSWGIDHHQENLVNLLASTIISFIRENQNNDVLDGFFFRNLFYRVEHKIEEGTFVDIDGLKVSFGKVHADRKPHQLWTTLFYIALKEAGLDPDLSTGFYRTLGFEMPRFVTHPTNVWLVDATVSLELPASPLVSPPTAPSAPAPERTGDNNFVQMGGISLTGNPASRAPLSPKELDWA